MLNHQFFLQVFKHLHRGYVADLRDKLAGHTYIEQTSKDLYNHLRTSSKLLRADAHFSHEVLKNKLTHWVSLMRGTEPHRRKGARNTARKMQEENRVSQACMQLFLQFGFQKPAAAVQDKPTDRRGNAESAEAAQAEAVACRGAATDTSVRDGEIATRGPRNAPQRRNRDAAVDDAPPTPEGTRNKRHAQRTG